MGGWNRGLAPTLRAGAVRLRLHPLLPILFPLAGLGRMKIRRLRTDAFLQRGVSIVLRTLGLEVVRQRGWGGVRG